MMRVACALVIVAATSGCLTPLGNACAQALGEVAAQTCSAFLTSICDDEINGDHGGDDGDAWVDDAERPPTREPPPPGWEPTPGALACDVAEDDDGNTRVSCADGTRARFDTAALRALNELVEDEATRAEDACRGRVRLQGLDDDGDGQLDDTEITGRTLVCTNDLEFLSPTLVGDLAIHGTDDVVRIAGRRAASGALTIAGPALVELTLPSLRSIGGSLRVTRSPQLRALSFASLASVGGDVAYIGTSLMALGLPALRNAGGVEVTDNAALPQAELERVVRRLTKNGFAGPVRSGGNGP